MINIRKVTSNIKLEFTYKMFGYSPRINGTMTIHQGRGKKIITIEFVWDMGAAMYPTIKGQPYDELQTRQLANMLNFYIKFIEPDKV